MKLDEAVANLRNMAKDKANILLSVETRRSRVEADGLADDLDRAYFDKLTVRRDNTLRDLETLNVILAHLDPKDEA